MNRKRIGIHVLIPVLVFLLFFSTGMVSQNKEYDKLKDLVDKGKLEKAKEYCDKVTASMDPETAARFYSLMGLAYFNDKDYENSAGMLLKSNDKKLSAKLAKEFENQENEIFDLKTACDLYIVAEEYVKAARILFNEGKYEESARICNSPATNYNFGKQLFDAGKYQEALIYFKRAKSKGKKFENDTILNYYYDRREYKQVYAIQNFGEGNFILHIQGTVIAKMVEKNEPNSFISQFLDSVGIKDSKHHEALLNAYVINKMFSQAQNYCQDKKGSEQQACLVFYAEITGIAHPEYSAWANLKLNKTVLGKQQLTSYLTNKAVECNNQWEKEPVPKDIIDKFLAVTKPAINNCNQQYKDIIGLASTNANSLSTDTAKKDKLKSKEYLKASIFLKQIEKICN